MPVNPSGSRGFATPVRGLVVRHAFLWSHEKAAGRQEGRKDRPAVIVLTVKEDDRGRIRVGVVPVTHTPPADPDGALEVPDDVKRQLGFDMARQWIVLDQLNRFVWPGYDLRRVPRTAASHYGMLPRQLFDTLLEAILTRHAARKLVTIDRD